MPKHRREGSENRDRRSWGHGSQSMERDAKRTKSRRNRSRTPSYRDNTPTRNRRYRSPSRSTSSTVRDRSPSKERVHRRRSRSKSSEPPKTRSLNKTDRSLHRDNHQMNKSEIDKLTGALSNQIQLSSMVTGENDELSGKILPIFDPECKDSTAGGWVSEVNLCGDIHRWSDWQKLYLATLRLRGCARGWFEQISVSNSPILSWQEFSTSIVEKFPFPTNLSFGQTFEDVVKFTSDSSGMSLMNYHFEKINRINRLNLELSEDKIFELVVHGISDVELRMKAHVYCKDKSLGELDKFFNIYADEEMRKKNQRREVEGNQRNGRNYQPKGFRRPERGNNGCFNCGEVGHQKRSCPGLRRGNSPLD